MHSSAGFTSITQFGVSVLKGPLHCVESLQVFGMLSIPVTRITHEPLNFWLMFRWQLRHLSPPDGCDDAARVVLDLEWGCGEMEEICGEIAPRKISPQLAFRKAEFSPQSPFLFFGRAHSLRNRPAQKCPPT
jgi:hypothetical protein